MSPNVLRAKEAAESNLEKSLISLLSPVRRCIAVLNTEVIQRTLFLNSAINIDKLFRFS